MSFKRLVAAAAIAAALGAMPAAAGAGTNIGATCDTPGYVSSAAFQFTVGVGAPSYTVPPGGGILTRWAVAREPAAVASPIKLKLLKPTGVPNQFTIVGDELQTVGPGENEFVARVPVIGGEILGSFGVNAGTTPYCGFSGSSLANLTPPGDPALGATVTKNATGNNAVLDLAAYVEPDADGDLYGDESQDACPSNATTQGACPPVDAAGPAINTKAFKLSKLLKKSKIEMTISSNEAATVTLDGTLSVPGGSSKTYKLKPVSKPVAANGKVKIKLKVPKKGLKALRKRKKATAVVNVSARDAAGNTSTGKFTSKMKIVKTRRVIHR